MISSITELEIWIRTNGYGLWKLCEAHTVVFVDSSRPRYSRVCLFCLAWLNRSVWGIFGSGMITHKMEVVNETFAVRQWKFSVHITWHAWIKCIHSPWRQHWLAGWHPLNTGDKKHISDIVTTAAVIAEEKLTYYSFRELERLRILVMAEQLTQFPILTNIKGFNYFNFEFFYGLWNLNNTILEWNSIS